MIRKYTTLEERINALKNAIDLRRRWKEAISRNASCEEMEKEGLITVMPRKDK